MATKGNGNGHQLPTRGQEKEVLSIGVVAFTINILAILGLMVDFLISIVLKS